MLREFKNRKTSQTGTTLVLILVSDLLECASIRSVSQDFVDLSEFREQLATKVIDFK